MVMSLLIQHTLIQYISRDFGKENTAVLEMMNENQATELLEAQAHIWNHTFNYITSMSLKCAIQLGIPDIISNHDKPLTISDLVKALSIPEVRAAHVFRLMRILVHSGFFAIESAREGEKEEGYMLTPSSRLLTKNHGTNLSPFVSMMIDPVVVKPFESLSDWFRGMESTPFETAHGTGIWKYCSQHPDGRKNFNEAMASDAEFVARVMVKEYKEMFEGFESMVDVGGGTGTLAEAISVAFPNLRCAVLDLPHVISDVQGSRNVNYVGGDMFESVPCADLILLKWIMHDWSDEECVKILKRCREALPVKGKLIIIDIVVDDNEGKPESIETRLCFDILMMVLVTGKERTAAEWEKLFLEAGFTTYKVTRGLGLRSIIEIFP